MWVLIVGIVIAVWAFWVANEVAKNKEDMCSHDCNQGRNCTCFKTQTQPYPEWPFPRSEK